MTAKAVNDEAFFAKIRTYADLSDQAERAWAALLRRRQFKREEPYIVAGAIPTTFAFVVEGLFSQHYVGPEGDVVIKYFFPEGRIAASVSATLLGEPSLFGITAIEDSTVLEYDFAPSSRWSPGSPTLLPSTSGTSSATGSSKRNRARSRSGTTTRCSAIATSFAASPNCTSA